MSYDTFFTLKRLIERSRRPDEVLRWVTQNPDKVSHNHYPIALHKISQLLGARPSPPDPPDAKDGVAPGGPGDGRQVLEQQDFRTLCDAIDRERDKLDNFSIVNCLYAVAALGLPSDCPVVQVLEAESQSRLIQFNQKDVSMVFSSSMRLHPASHHPLTEACVAALERNLERERHPQTLFLLLAYYRLRWRSLQPAESATTPPNPEQLLINRKILRLVKHTLASVSAVREQEMALLDEMLAACVREASNKSLELIFSSQLFYQNRQERFIGSLAEELPRKADSVTPYTMALIAKYIARHRLRDTRLLDTIADFLVKKAEYLDSKVIQKLVFPFSRMSYRPSNEARFFSRLDQVLELKALSSPLATVNVLMSLFQLQHCSAVVLQRVFSPAFICSLSNSPYALIVRRYLSLLDAAVELEYPEYSGARLQEAHKVLMFDHALTADEVNRKYSYKGLVAEALRQLVGEQSYKQDEVLAPGYYTDFLLLVDGSGRVLPIRSLSDAPPPKLPDGSVSVATLTSDFQRFSPFGPDVIPATSEPFLPPPGSDGGAGPPVSAGPPGGVAPGLDYGYYGAAEYYCPGSRDSSTLSSPPSGAPSAGAPESLFQFSIGTILQEDQGGAPGAEPAEPQGVRRVVMSVNDRWHYCHNSSVLVGSRAMRDRHLTLLGYVILQLPYQELEQLSGIEDVKQYLHHKLLGSTV